MTEDRHSGVEFGDLMSDLEDVEYPCSADDVIEQFGDREVTHANGSETVRELLEPVGDATYDSADGVRRVSERFLLEVFPFRLDAPVSVLLPSDGPFPDHVEQFLLNVIGRLVRYLLYRLDEFPYRHRPVRVRYLTVAVLVEEILVRKRILLGLEVVFEVTERDP